MYWGHPGAILRPSWGHPGVGAQLRPRRDKPKAGDGIRFENGRDLGPWEFDPPSLRSTRCVSLLSWRGKPKAGDGTRPLPGRDQTILGSSTLPLSVAAHSGLTRLYPPRHSGITFKHHIHSPNIHHHHDLLIHSSGETSRKLATAPGWKPGETLVLGSSTLPLSVRPSVPRERLGAETNTVSVAQWSSAALPMRRRGFDSRRSLSPQSPHRSPQTLSGFPASRAYSSAGRARRFQRRGRGFETRSALYDQATKRFI